MIFFALLLHYNEYTLLVIFIEYKKETNKFFHYIFSDEFLMKKCVKKGNNFNNLNTNE